MRTLLLGTMMLLAATGCAGFSEEYSTRYGLANPETPAINPNPLDEAYGSGTIGQRHIEEYEEKYYEQDIYRHVEEEPSETQEQLAE